MIKLGLKNYYKSYRYFFVPLGAVALGVVVALSVMIPLMGSAIRDFVRGVGKIMGDHPLDWGAVKDTLGAAFRDLDWSHPQQVMDQVFTKGYWTSLLQSCATAALGDTSAWRAEIDALASSTLSKLTGALIVGAVFVVIGVFLAFFVTRRLIRHDIAKGKWWKILLLSFADAIINAFILGFGAWLVLKAKVFWLLAIFLVIVIYAAISFLEAYLVHGHKKVPVKQVLHFKNFFNLILLTAIEIAIMVGLVAVVRLISNVMVASFVGFSIFIITQSCIALNSEAFVKELVAKGAADSPEEASATQEA